MVVVVTMMVVVMLGSRVMLIMAILLTANYECVAVVGNRNSNAAANERHGEDDKRVEKLHID